MIYRFRDWQRRRSTQRLVTEIKGHIHNQDVRNVHTEWDKALFREHPDAVRTRRGLPL